MKPTPEELQALHHWMREPHWAENFSLEDIVDWMNRRLTSVTHRLDESELGAFDRAYFAMSMKEFLARNIEGTIDLRPRS
jgi:hypothetical protein